MSYPFFWLENDVGHDTKNNITSNHKLVFGGNYITQTVLSVVYA